MPSVGLVIPTLNPGRAWGAVLEQVFRQSLRPARVLVIDSSSGDETVATARSRGCEVRVIPRAEFDHGATRQLAAEMLHDVDVIVYLTQDALLAGPEALASLVAVFSDGAVGCASGRQLPHADAGPIGAHARLFNYPAESAVRTLQDASRLGIKAAFISNSFAAYRRSALIQAGGFPSRVILSEDMLVAARMLLAGWKVAYCAEAKVLHSHDYSPAQEFRRYFDIGVFHAREPWVRGRLGNAEGEGARFALSELRYLLHHAPRLVPSALLRSALKYAGYRLGLLERYLPPGWKRRLSMHPRYWREAEGADGLKSVR